MGNLKKSSLEKQAVESRLRALDGLFRSKDRNLLLDSSPAFTRGMKVLRPVLLEANSYPF